MSVFNTHRNSWNKLTDERSVAAQNVRYYDTEYEHYN